MPSEGFFMERLCMSIEIGSICLARVRSQDTIVKTVYFNIDSGTWLCTFLDEELGDTLIHLDEDRLEPLSIRAVDEHKTAATRCAK